MAVNKGSAEKSTEVSAIRQERIRAGMASSSGVERYDRIDAMALGRARWPVGESASGAAAPFTSDDRRRSSHRRGGLDHEVRSDAKVTKREASPCGGRPSCLRGSAWLRAPAAPLTRPVRPRTRRCRSRAGPRPATPAAAPGRSDRPLASPAGGRSAPAAPGGWIRYP